MTFPLLRSSRVPCSGILRRPVQVWVLLTQVRPGLRCVGLTAFYDGPTYVGSMLMTFLMVHCPARGGGHILAFFESDDEDFVVKLAT